MIRHLREELREFREPMMIPDEAARFDVEAGVPREVGEARYIAAACGPMEPDFEPAENPEHQSMAARLSELRPSVEELRQDVRRDEEIVDALPAHPILWVLLLCVAIPAEIICGIQLFQTIGMQPQYRVAAAYGLTVCTFGVASLLRSMVTSYEEKTGWQRVRAALGVGLVVLVACLVVVGIAFARLNPGGEVGVPVAARLGRLILLILITMGPAVAFKYAIDRLRETLKPRRELRAHRRELKRLEREQTALARDIASIRQKAGKWRSDVGSHGARYQAAYDRANASRTRSTNSDRAPETRAPRRTFE